MIRWFAIFFKSIISIKCKLYKFYWLKHCLQIHSHNNILLKSRCPFNFHYESFLLLHSLIPSHQLKMNCFKILVSCNLHSLLTICIFMDFDPSKDNDPCERSTPLPCNCRSINRFTSAQKMHNQFQFSHYSFLIIKSITFPRLLAGHKIGCKTFMWKQKSLFIISLER